MDYQYVEDKASLDLLCERLAKAEVLAIDTEFVRTRTLYPKLGLLQVYDGNELALIDPVTIEDLSPFWQLLTNDKIVKVLHACSEDLEVFLHSGSTETNQCKPVNLIDSQIVMSFLGHGLSMGYAAMVKHYTGVELDKSESRTDWLKRPLTVKQLDYASADVEYLYQIYPQMIKDINEKGWLEQALQESQSLIEKKCLPIDENTLYKNIKMNWRLNPKQLNTLKYLTAWRYLQAKQRDISLGFVVKDNTLVGLAQSLPTSVEAMSKIEGVEVRDIKHKGKTLLGVMRQAQSVKESDYPKKITRLDNYPHYKSLYKLIKSFIQETAEANGLTPDNLASKRQINQFLTWHFNLNDARKSSIPVELIHGWRLALFGEELQALIEQQGNV
ncbi:MAG: ribonuclease D [Colwellia sp.]